MKRHFKTKFRFCIFGQTSLEFQGTLLRMDAQKRRRNRVQGSWASQTRSGRDGAPGNSRDKTSSSSPLKLNNASVFSQEIKEAALTEQQNSPTRITKGGKYSNAKDGRLFVFEQDVAKSVKLPSAEKVIRCEGVYDISQRPNGVSRLEFYPNFIPFEETQWMFEQLHAEIPWQAKNIKIKGEYHRQPRLTAWFGDFSYSYSGLLLKPIQWSPLLEMLRERIFMRTGDGFNSMLANLYRNEKDSVDWHCDDEPSLGVQPTIASLSFGETRHFELRKKPLEGNDYSITERIKIPLTSGSLLIMRGAVQQDWQHRIPKEYHDRGPRINLTFRTIQPVENG